MKQQKRPLPCSEVLHIFNTVWRAREYSISALEQTHTARVSVGLQGGGYTGLNKAEEWEEAGGDKIADDFMDKVKKVTWEEKAEEWEES